MIVILIITIIIIIIIISSSSSSSNSEGGPTPPAGMMFLLSYSSCWLYVLVGFRVKMCGLWGLGFRGILSGLGLRA